jgi:hypothetical protein
VNKALRMKTDNEKVRKLVADVQGERDWAEFDEHLVTVETPFLSDERSGQEPALLDEPDVSENTVVQHLSTAAILWSKMVSAGAEEGSKGRLEAVFLASTSSAADAILEEVESAEGWVEDVVRTEQAAQIEVSILTRPLFLGYELVSELSKQMTMLGDEFGCEFVELRPVFTTSERSR